MHFLNKIYEKKEFCENLTNVKRNIVFDDTRSFIFIDCSDIEFYIDGNVTNLFFQNCSNCIVSVNNIIAKIEILRSSKLYIDVDKEAETPVTIQVDIAHDIEIDIEHPCIIQTISCIDVIINRKPLLCSMLGDIRTFELTS